MNRPKRKTISSEVYGQWNKKNGFVPPSYPKSEEQIESIKTRIKGIFMFDNLNPNESQILAEALVPKKFKADDVVIKEGDDGNLFYIVESGHLNCFKRLNPTDDKDTFLKEYKAGETFGELALLYNDPRAASIIAKDDVELWSLDRQTFVHIVSTSAILKREKVENFLYDLEILQSIKDEVKEKMIDSIRDCWFQPGECLIN